MDKDLNLIKEAEEILKRPYARVQSIANAWELLLNREQAHSEARRLRIEGIKDFIEGLNLPICYEDGSLAIRTTGSSVAEILNRNSICVSVMKIEEHARGLNLPWPTLPSNETVKESVVEAESEAVKDLKDKIRTLAIEFIQKHKAKDLHPSQKDVANHLERVTRELSIYGVHKKPMSASYLQRNYIGGDWWKANNSKKMSGKSGK